MDKGNNDRDGSAVRICSLILLLAIAACTTCLRATEAFGQAALAEANACLDLRGQQPEPEQIAALVSERVGKNPRRLAVVIGNNYVPDPARTQSPHAIPKLTNPTNDARRIAELLNTLKFRVICMSNLDATTLDRLATAVSSLDRTSEDGITLFYFSGHGYSHQGVSYIVGDGARRDQIDTLNRGSIPYNAIIQGVNSRGTTGIYIIDACRNRIELSTESGKRALGQQALDTYKPHSQEQGILIHYSAAPGGVANDLPKAPNGLYAMVFLEEVPKYPGAAVTVVLQEKIGKRLSDGLEISNDGVFSQKPNLVSFPGEWSNVSLYDVVDEASLDMGFSSLNNAEAVFAQGNIGLACNIATYVRGLWGKSAQRTLFGKTVEDLLTAIAALQAKIKQKGVSCGEVIGMNTVTRYSVFIPPLVHSVVLKKMLPGVQSKAKYSANQGTWLATAGQKMTMAVDASGTVRVANLETPKLQDFFSAATEDDPKVKLGGDRSKNELIVFKTPLDRKIAAPAQTGDQVIVTFHREKPEIVDPTEFSRQLNDLTSLLQWHNQVFLMFPKGPSGLPGKRLAFARTGAIYQRLVEAGVPEQSLVWPDFSGLGPATLATLNDDEILIKIVDSMPTTLLANEALWSTAVTSDFARLLSGYRDSLPSKN